MNKLTNKQKDIANRYKYIIAEVIKQCNVKLEDYYDDLEIYYLECIPSWNKEQSSFLTYISHKLKHRIYQTLNKKKKDKHILYTVSNLNILDRTNNPEYILSYKEIVKDLYKNSVIKLKLQGLSKQDIAKQLDKSVYWVDKELNKLYQDIKEDIIQLR